jgi:hypothetical protein
VTTDDAPGPAGRQAPALAARLPRLASPPAGLLPTRRTARAAAGTATWAAARPLALRAGEIVPAPGLIQIQRVKCGETATDAQASHMRGMEQNHKF